MSALRGLVYALAIEAVAAAVIVTPFVVHDIRAGALPSCQRDDGNPDDTPCTWFDRDTGQGHDYGDEYALRASVIVDCPAGIACDELPVCEHEDGSPDGLPCVWFSPRTGVGYYNDGANYRD